MKRGGRKPAGIKGPKSAAVAAENTIREGGGDGVEAEQRRDAEPGAKVTSRGSRSSRRSKKSSSSSSPSNPPSSPSASSLLRAAVDEWTRRTGEPPDAAVRIEGRRFRLHKEPLVSRSGYLRRLLQAASDLTIPKPAPASPDTFAAAALFCYSSDVRLAASNVPALRIAAEWLQMSGEDDAYSGVEVDEEGEPTEGPSLLEATEQCFCEDVATAIKTGQAASLLQSCLDLIPRAPEAAAGLVGRCMEGMEQAGKGGEYLALLMEVAPGDFRNIAASISARNSQCHDTLYAVVDRYLQARGTDLTEEDKSRICNPICCALLTRPRLVNLVQNPRMPLRFVVQAMLAEHQNTRRSLLVPQQQTPLPFASPAEKQPLTLGDILEREAAVRQQAGLRAAAEATSFRIYTLEKDIAAMRRKLRQVAAVEGAEPHGVVAGSGRSQSCRFLAEVVRPGKTTEWGDYFEDEEGLSPAGTCSGRFGYEISDSFCDESVRSAAVVPNAKEVDARAKRRSSVGSAVLRGLKSVFRAAAWTGGAKGAGGGGKRRVGMSCGRDGDVVSVGELQRTNLNKLLNNS